MSKTAPKILILFAHPAPHRSRVNRRMIDAAAKLPNVTVRDLYETYPDFSIDVPAEQALLAEADLVVFQHPLQWYAMPALMKEWVDVVLEHGWAYGPGGTALQGKHYWMVTTTGGIDASYQKGGYHRHNFSDFLPAFEMTAHLCGMVWVPPLVLHGAHQVDEEEVTAFIEKYKTLLATYPDWLALP